MLIKAKTLSGYQLCCLDGEIGQVKDFVFDEKKWTVRYLTAETGSWLIDRQVLVSTTAITAIDKKTKHIVVNLSKQQIEDSPLLYKETTISRKFETSYDDFFGYNHYWASSPVWATDPNMMAATTAYKEATQGDKDLAPGLRSTANVRGRKLRTLDGEIGHIADFVLDDENWVIRYLDIDTINWWPSKHVLICPDWIGRIGLEDYHVYVDLTREQIKNSPEYNNNSDLDRDYEQCLHNHYCRKGYWENCIDENKE